MRSKSWQAAEYPALYARFEVFLEDLYSVVRLSAAAEQQNKIVGNGTGCGPEKVKLTFKVVGQVGFSVDKVRVWQ